MKIHSSVIDQSPACASCPRTTTDTVIAATATPKAIRSHWPGVPSRSRASQTTASTASTTPACTIAVVSAISSSRSPQVPVAAVSCSFAAGKPPPMST
ncbi:hypothetical protein SAMN05421504_103722 [Amycolatopsis xylanica]|uniref:Uncharacterized protein n=1 Tax=Amycolatopsis xylanica TaxID=589385 RepID=A0A1H3ECH4_9PSEU|nr:hypothetical protein SAMN05421504_103722 [Amycolatopsis xylanica]